MTRIFASFFLIAFVLLAPVMAMAQSGPIGTVIAVEGDNALIMRAAEQGKATPATADAPVFMNDVLQTGPGGRMLVALLDDSQFTLGENARMKIDAYVYDDEDDTANMARYNVLQGTFLYTSGLIAKKETPDVKIGIPYGSIGIRGTTVWGGTLDNEYGVFVADGEITVETNRGRIRVAKDEGTTIRNANAIPERAKIWEVPKITRATDTVSMKNIEKIKERTAYFQQNRAALIAQHRSEIHARRLSPQNAVPRGGSTKDRRLQHQKPVAPPVAPPSKKDILDKKSEALQDKTGLQKDTLAPLAPSVAPPSAPVAPAMKAPLKNGAAEMPFPKPAVVENIMPEDLPADPARRQEAIERQMLQRQAPAAPAQRDPFH